MIVIRKSETADTRSCDFSQVTKEQLLKSSEQHIDDVDKGIQFFISLLNMVSADHDSDKLWGIDSFHSDFIT